MHVNVLGNKCKIMENPNKLTLLIISVMWLFKGSFKRSLFMKIIEDTSYWDD